MVEAGAFLEHPFPPPTAWGQVSRRGPLRLLLSGGSLRHRTALAAAGPRSEASGPAFTALHPQLLL